MSERVFQLSALRIGRTDVGDAVLTIDDDTLVFAVHGDREARALRVTHASIDTLRQTATELALTLRDGTTIAIDVLPELADELVGRCQTVPELTRTLRSFGSRRRGPRVARAAPILRAAARGAPRRDARQGSERDRRVRRDGNRQGACRHAERIRRGEIRAAGSRAPCARSGARGDHRAAGWGA